MPLKVIDVSSRDAQALCGSPMVLTRADMIVARRGSGAVDAGHPFQLPSRVGQPGVFRMNCRSLEKRRMCA